MQASGLPCIVSKTVTEEAHITENYKTCLLEEAAEHWANKIIQFDDKLNDRTSAYQRVANAGYDIEQVAKELQDYYLNHECF